MGLRSLYNVLPVHYPPNPLTQATNYLPITHTPPTFLLHVPPTHHLVLIPPPIQSTYHQPPPVPSQQPLSIPFLNSLFFQPSYDHQESSSHLSLSPTDQPTVDLTESLESTDEDLAILHEEQVQFPWLNNSSYLSNAGQLRVLSHCPCTFLSMVARNCISEIIVTIAMKLTPY